MTTSCRVQNAVVGRSVPTAPLRRRAFLTGDLTLSNGLPNGSDFCKSLKTQKVYGLTGKIPPGRHYPACSAEATERTRVQPRLPSVGLLAKEGPPPALRSAFGGGGSDQIRPNPTKSDQIKPAPLHPRPSTLSP
jgi:hypothetical protein